MILNRKKLNDYFSILLLVFGFVNTSILPGFLAPVSILLLIYVAVSILILLRTGYLVVGNGINWAIFFILIWASLVSIFTIKDISQLSYYIIFLTNFLTVYFLSVTEINYTRMLRWLSFLFFFSLLIGLFENLTGLHLPNSRHYDYSFYYSDPSIPTGTFYNENNYASITSIGAALFFARAFFENKLLFKVFYCILYITSIYIVLSTGSRINSAMVFLPIFLFSIRFINLSLSNRFSFKLRKILFYSMFVFLLSFSFVVSYGMIEVLFNQITAADSADLIRFELARLGFDILVNSYYLGSGPMAFELTCFGSSAYANGGICSPHNWLIELGANFGAISIICQIYIYIYLGFYFFNKFVFEGVSSNSGVLFLTFSSVIPVVFSTGISISSIINFPVVWVMLSLANNISNYRGGKFD
ncbi:hypothetical protein [Vibrio profundi]|uniref:hypothetical protein n=1 Tax=Vibrio profundi TaxID=1774960 RepID=UPI00373575E3